MLTTEGALNKDNLPVPLSASDPVVKGGSVRIFTNTWRPLRPRVPSALGEFGDLGSGGNHWDYFPFNVTDPLTNRGYQFKDSTGLHDTPIGVVKIIAGTTMKLKGKDQMTLHVGYGSEPGERGAHAGNYRYCFVMNGTGANGFRSGWTAGKIAWAKNVDARRRAPAMRTRLRRRGRGQRSGDVRGRLLRAVGHGGRSAARHGRTIGLPRMPSCVT